MTDRSSLVRSSSFGQRSSLSPVDRFGVWLSGRRVRREARTLAGARIADVGCGFDATLARSLVDEAAAVTVLDVKVNSDLSALPKVRVVEGVLPDTLSVLDDNSHDLVLCLSVLEHLWEPEPVLTAFHRILAPGGTCLINVPSWRGKRFLEYSAFRLGLSPAEEMDDHKWYFDPRDLWPLLVRAGFLPHNIRCFRHKFGLNTFATCKRDGIGR